MTKCTFRPLSEVASYGFHVTLNDWYRAIDEGTIDDEGASGLLATDTEVSDVHIFVSDSSEGLPDLPEWTTHVVMFLGMQ